MILSNWCPRVRGQGSRVGLYGSYSENALNVWKSSLKSKVLHVIHYSWVCPFVPLSLCTFTIFFQKLIIDYIKFSSGVLWEMYSVHSVEILIYTCHFAGYPDFGRYGVCNGHASRTTLSWCPDNRDLRGDQRDSEICDSGKSSEGVPH